MDRNRLILPILVIALSVGLCRAQTGEPANTPREVPAAGFWPTPKMVDRIVTKITIEMGKQYEMDDEQREKTRALVEEFPQWFEENRAEIMDLTNTYFEALLNEDPPTPEEVARWAQRVLPLMEGFKKKIEDTTGRMRGFLTDEQNDKLTQELAGVNVGFSMATGKLGSWAEGNYDPETEWIHSPGARERRMQEEAATRAATEAARAEALAAAEAARQAQGLNGNGSSDEGMANVKPLIAKNRNAKTPPRPKDSWEEYVEGFIKRYSLSGGQQEQAYRILHAMQDDRDQYLTKKAPEVERVEKLTKAAKTEEEKSRAKAEFERLYKPLDTRFTQLKDRLERIPTAKQRKDAADADLKNAPKAVGTDNARTPTTAPASAERGTVEKPPAGGSTP